MLGEIGGVADGAQVPKLLPMRHVRQVIALLRIQPDDVLLGAIRQGRVPHEIRPRPRAHARDQPIRTERLAVQEACRSKSSVRILVVPPREFVHIDVQFAQQCHGGGPICGRTVDRLRAAVAQQRAVADVKFIALGVPAEVIMVVEQQDPRAGKALAVEICGRQSTEPCPYDDKIVVLAGVPDRCGPALKVPSRS
jgi:hypothetical protein